MGVGQKCPTPPSLGKRCKGVKCGGVIWVDGVPISVFLAALEAAGVEYGYVGCKTREEVEELARDATRCIVATYGQGHCGGEKEEVYIASSCLAAAYVYDLLDQASEEYEEVIEEIARKAEGEAKLTFRLSRIEREALEYYATKQNITASELARVALRILNP